MMDVRPYYDYTPGPFKVYKANSGAISFQMKLVVDFGFAQFAFTSKSCPHKDMYRFVFGPHCIFEDVTKKSGEQSKRFFQLPLRLLPQFQEYWVSWYNGVICLGQKGQNEPFFQYADSKIISNNIGYVKFHTTCHPHCPVDWVFDTPPPILNAKTQMFEDGKLRWERMTEGRLPKDALIGGVEGEPIYIARALHNRSCCPGKYVPSQDLAYVPWGSFEHAKSDFEILCGYNAEWVKTKGNSIPPNAFIAGSSEVRNEPLYIGRAIYDGNLLVGKIHALYNTCYLPYQGKEVEVHECDILVSSDVVPRGILAA